MSPRENSRGSTRREFIGGLSLTAAVGMLGLAAGASRTVFAQNAPLKIGIIGTGRIGSALARHWVKAGHEVLRSSRHPDELKPLASELGARARVGTPREAAAFGDVVLVSVPYSAMPQIGRDYAAELKGKIVLDTSNPVERRDGPMAAGALKKGSGVASSEYLAGTRLVRAFNCIPAASLANEGNRRPERIAIPIAGDDDEALAIAKRLIDEAGFDSVVVGGLESARRFDLGQPLASKLMTAAELERAVKEGA
ncbi:MAG TPA: NAD(P)-binding domain-containing protein [Gammaproteobacteria bacterium]|nr:NAD(P)-binding domain-containing protein [Gammaproteobacteria bacterium]